MAEPNDPISTMVERLDETVMTPELTIEEQVEVAIPGSLRPKEMARLGNRSADRGRRQCDSGL